MTANQGTDYAYFKPQLAAHGVRCDMLTWTPYLSVSCAVRSRVEDMLRGDYYFIALMKKALDKTHGRTSSRKGHAYAGAVQRDHERNVLEQMKNNTPQT